MSSEYGSHENASKCRITKQWKNNCQKYTSTPTNIFNQRASPHCYPSTYLDECVGAFTIFMHRVDVLSQTAVSWLIAYERRLPNGESNEKLFKPSTPSNTPTRTSICMGTCVWKRLCGYFVEKHLSCTRFVTCYYQLRSFNHPQFEHNKLLCRQGVYILGVSIFTYACMCIVLSHKLKNAYLIVQS